MAVGAILGSDPAIGQDCSLRGRYLLSILVQSAHPLMHTQMRTLHPGLLSGYRDCLQSSHESA